MFTGTVTTNGGRGFWFIERDHTRDSVFCHQRSVVDRRFLNVNDRVRFNLAPSVTKLGEMQAVDVEIVGLMIARQIGETAVKS